MKPIIKLPQGTDFVNALELVRQIAKALAEAGRPAEGDAAPHFINATNTNFYMMDAAIKGGKLRAFIDGNAPATRLDSRCIILVDDARDYLAGIGFGLALSNTETTSAGLETTGTEMPAPGRHQTRQTPNRSKSGTYRRDTLRVSLSNLIQGCWGSVTYCAKKLWSD